ncbi:MAG: hypothetical protein OXH70_01715 [Acidobacteria bacterium]|nr:hypothetical protein [Acidobacteriota bacterium]
MPARGDRGNDPRASRVGAALETGDGDGAVVLGGRRGGGSVDGDALPRWRRNPEPRSKRPLKVRQRQWTRAQESAIAAFRCQYPAWGRRRIGDLLRHPVRGDSCAVSISDATVGRILAHLVTCDRARPVLCFAPAARKRRSGRRDRSKRLRGALKASRPGDAVQIDTLSIWFPSNHTVQQFTAVDRCSRWGQGMTASRATAASAKRFLDRLIEQAPFKVRAIQVDGGQRVHGRLRAGLQ